MPRPPLAVGVHLTFNDRNPDGWTWDAARALLPPGTRVVPLVPATETATPAELGVDGRWHPFDPRNWACEIVALPPGWAPAPDVPAPDAPAPDAPGEAGGGELVALRPVSERPALPEALALPDDPVEVQVRDALVEAGARSIELLVADVRANPGRALRRLRVIERVSHVLREGVAELGLDDEDEGLGDGFEEAGMMGGPRRRRRRPGFAGGHAYGAGADQQTMLNGAVRAQHMQALVQTIERTAPNGATPNPAVYDAASRELALLFPDAQAPRAPADGPPAPDGATIAAPPPDGAAP